MVFFIKDASGKIYSKSSIINQLEIDFLPSFFIRENKICCSVQSSEESLEFAFYLYQNEEKVRKIWYSKSNTIEFQIDEAKLETFELKYFVRDLDSNIISRTIEYEKFEPEENPNKANNQYNFFISMDKKKIYKSIIHSNSQLSELLEKPGKMERFSKILNGKQFSSQISNHIVKGFDEEPNGSYKSKFIEGYRLDLISLLIHKYPSLKLHTKFNIENVLLQCGILLKALQEAESSGELCGDWALHNLIYSIEDDKIYNVDLEGFMTYDPLPEWANLEKIISWIDNLKHKY